jgi:hypothetical protein
LTTEVLLCLGPNIKVIVVLFSTGFVLLRKWFLKEEF